MSRRPIQALLTSVHWPMTMSDDRSMSSTSLRGTSWVARLAPPSRTVSPMTSPRRILKWRTMIGVSPACRRVLSAAGAGAASSKIQQNRLPSVTRRPVPSRTSRSGVSLETAPRKEVPMEADTQDLIFTLEDRVATLTLNRPDRLNALSDAMIDAAVDALRRCATDPEVGAVLVTGAGRAFCAGGDVSAMGAGAARRTFEDHEI